MSMGDLASRIDDRHREAASEWFVMLQSPNAEPSPELLQQWVRWISVPEHRRAYDAIEDTWGSVGALQRPRSASHAARATDDYDGSISVAQWRKKDRAFQPGDRRRPTRPAPIRVLVAATLLAAAIGLAWVSGIHWRPNGLREPVIAHETRAAEHQEIRLSDGSTIALGAKTEITAQYGDSRRTVVLIRGEALFRVAHDPKRPFQVVAGGAAITAVGTAFNVRRRDDQVVVTVSEGSVEVTPLPEHAVEEQDGNRVDVTPRQHWTKRVERGEEISYDAGGRFIALRVADAELAIAWRDGRLEYRSEPLRNVIPDVNRYSRRPIILGDPAVGELLFTGTVFERDVEEWITGLEKIFPALDVLQTGTHHILMQSGEAQSRVQAAP